MKLELSSQFKTDYKKVKYSGRYNISEVDRLIKRLANNEPLEIKNCDHELSGTFKGIRECHIFPDLLLMYKYISTGLYLIRLGKHSELFL